MKKLVKQLRHGQITIPKEFREALGLEETDMLSISLGDGKLEVEPVRVEPKVKGSPWAKELYDLYAPVRTGLKDIPEEEINEAIDEAVREVRARKS
jgi:AbrB family looped-hinge helix DNA binding protein